MGSPSNRNSYWRDNLLVVSILLLVWFLAGFVCSIFGIAGLNQIQVGKVGFGFWMAQQGSIFVFVILILIYAIVMDRIDKKHGVDE